MYGGRSSTSALTTVLVHGVATFGTARLMKMDLDLAAVASQANVGGGTSALALARGIGCTDLVLPAVLLGSRTTIPGVGIGKGLYGFTVTCPISP
ncbi:MAG: DUF819 family protein [Phaeodactylibacter sp.]|nr:DUF819 family protein [Phaeodactylibacter sp.]